MSTQRIIGVVPARLGSTRLPRKVLRELAGRPLVDWVWRAASESGLMERVLVATDSSDVMECCASRGIPAEITSVSCASGSDRVFEIAGRYDADIYVNIQGDEPLLTPEHFKALLAPFTDEAVEVTTLATPCSAEEIMNPNAVKVVCGLDGRALYFSRATIPYDRDQARNIGCQKHLGIYAYRKAALGKFARLKPSPLEMIEKLEQLRLLENGIGIVVAQAPTDTIGVDTEEDLKRAETELLTRLKQVV